MQVYLPFLVWNQEKMRRAADKELKKILETSQKVGQAYRIVTTFVDKTKDSSFMIAKQSLEIDNLVSKAKETNKEISKIKDLNEQIRKEAATSLATISQMSPQGTVTMAETPTPSKLRSLSEILFGQDAPQDVTPRPSTLQEVLEAVGKSRTSSDFSSVLREAKRLNEEELKK